MTAKQWLSRARNIDSEIDTLLLSYTETKERLTHITQQITGDPVQATKDPHKYDALAQLSDQINAKVDALIMVKKEIAEVVLALPKRNQREVLFRRYVGGESWPEIAEGLNYSQRAVFKIHGRGIIEVSEVLKRGRS